MTIISKNLENLHSELPKDCPVCVVAVSKYVSVDQIVEAYQAGVRDFGESRIQDFHRKRELLPYDIACKIRWHFIGHLQKNKVKSSIINCFALIQSLDSLELAEKLSELNRDNNTKQAVLLQVNVTQEPQKSGFSEEILRRDYARLLELAGIEIKGLMTIGPNVSQEEEIKSCFSHLADLREELIETFGHPRRLKYF